MSIDNDKQTRREERRNICMIIKDNKKARNDNDIHQLQITRLSHLFFIFAAH